MRALKEARVTATAEEPRHANSPACTSSASATGGSTCRPCATRSSSSTSRSRCCRPALRPLFPEQRIVGEAFTVEGHECPDVGWEEGIEPHALLPRGVRAADARLAARLDDPGGRGRPLRRADRQLRPGPWLRRRDPRRQPPRHRGDARDRLPGLLPRPLAAERDRPLGDDRRAAAGRDRRRDRRPGRHRLRRVRRDPRHPARPRRCAVLEKAEEIVGGRGPGARARCAAATRRWSSFERHGHI